MKMSGANSLSTDISQRLYERARRLIPGGTQLLSKRPEMYAPGQWPAYYQSAKGCEITDLDGNAYIDMSMMGVGACLLGYADPDITAAVAECIGSGAMCSLNAPEEVALAELLLELHPWAENVRYARTGGEAMAVAVRLARAATGRSLIAFCGYHGWHDWYLAANRSDSGPTNQLKGHLLPGLSPIGVPSQLAGTAFPFTYNKSEELASIVRQHGGDLAAVVMEPTRGVSPQPGFLESVQELCKESGAALVIDEISAGWRLALGGAHLLYGLEPDLAVFGKALGNGHPMAAVIGRSSIMQAAHESFISSTYWTERVGPTAALATIRKMQSIDVPAHVQRIGTAFRDGLQELARRHQTHVTISGHPALTTIAFDYADAAAIMTLFTVRMMDLGILAGSSFYPSWAHAQRHVDAYLAAADSVFPELSDAARAGDAAARIGGRIKHVGFRRLT